MIKGTGPAKGLSAALGCWWDHSTRKVVCLLDEEAKTRPVIAHLNALAKTVVPDFLASS